MSTEPTSQPQQKCSRPCLLPLGAVAISLGMVASTYIAASSWKDVRKRPDKNNIRITGSARKRIISDLIEWSARIEAQAPERTAAYIALKSGTDKAVAFLKAQGIKPEEIQTQSAFINEEFETIKEDKVLPGTNVAMRSEQRVSKGFKASQVVSVSSSNVALIEKASREITSLLEEGVLVTSSSPDYYYTRLGELKLEMLAEAAKDARSRAQNILQSAGNANVGKLVYADMGIININAANSTETSTEGNNDTSSRDKDIITIVHAEYQVD
ncbi:MAG: SIMPL domain-containing protein [Gloeobacteraceae cyanobacterium ES-bin-144]|nr:SIMPL domain-containing protein [Verrucomicrobiales bacterium]